MRSERVREAEKQWKAALKKAGTASVVAQFQDLQQDMLDKKFLMKGKAFPTFMKPYFIEADLMKWLGHTTQVIMNAVEKVGDLFFSSPEYENYFEMKAIDLELAKINPRYPRRVINGRLDAFLQETKAGPNLKFLEFNCDSPCGMGWHDQLISMIQGLPLYKGFLSSFGGRFEPIVPSLEKGLQTKSREFGNPGDSTFAVLCWDDSTVRYDLELVASYMDKAGQKAFWADNRDCAYDGKVLKMAGKPVGLVFRDAIQEFTDDMVKTKPVLDAYRDGKVCLVNPFSSRVGGLKCVLWFMTDPISGHLFNDEEKKVIHDTIPWTRFMRQGKTDYRGKKVDLFEFVRANRPKMVLKPNAGYGGFGVAIGKEKTPEEWDKVLEECAKGPWVVQEFVAIPNEQYPIVEDDVQWAKKNVNINFFAHNGEFGGGYVRVSDSSIINIHQGGGLVPICYI
jgi:hypothetical protein